MILVFALSLNVPRTKLSPRTRVEFYDLGRARLRRRFAVNQFLHDPRMVAFGTAHLDVNRIGIFLPRRYAQGLHDVRGTMRAGDVRWLRISR